MTQTRKKRLLWALCLVALALFAAAMVWGSICTLPKAG